MQTQEDDINTKPERQPLRNTGSIIEGIISSLTRGEQHVWIILRRRPTLSKQPEEDLDEACVREGELKRDGANDPDHCSAPV
jgi:hypothetical protein